MTAILGCCKGYTCVVSWVSMVTGTFQGESENDRGVGQKGGVKRVDIGLSCNVTEVELEGIHI